MGSWARPDQDTSLLRTKSQPHVPTSHAVDHGANKHRPSQHGANGYYIQLSTRGSQHDKLILLYANVPISTANINPAEDVGSWARPTQQTRLLRTRGQPLVPTSSAVDHDANKHRPSQHGAKGLEDQLRNHEKNKKRTRCLEQLLSCTCVSHGTLTTESSLCI
jgi:hypothetical protein